MYGLFRSLLFRLEPEKAHSLAFRFLPLVSSCSSMLGDKVPDLETKVWDLRFVNPIGLAAGFDKNALLLSTWAKLGFGFVEVGTITPRPQIGNPKPRLFRLTKDKALINRLGFNNDGLEKIAQRLERRPPGLIVGANIGKNKDTANDDALADYRKCFQRLVGLADYYVVNVSSPNTPGLRALQDKDALYKILSELQNGNQKRKQPQPLLVKIAPDLNEYQIADIIEVIKATHLSGAIATNTTLSRSNLQTPLATIEKIGAGGLSGAPLFITANQVLKSLIEANIQTIGVGGITKAQDAIDKFNIGACLVQLYTGFVYHGPDLIHEIVALERRNHLRLHLVR